MRNQVTIIGVSESVKQLRAFTKALKDLNGRRDKLIIDVYETESQYQRSREKAKLKFNTNMLQELFVVMGKLTYYLVEKCITKLLIMAYPLLKDNDICY